MTEKKWNVEVTREDVLNISKWMTATTMMIEARMRTPYSESEHNTWRKFQHIYHYSSTFELEVDGLDHSLKGERR